jgi:hypothetical protein
MGFSGDDSWGAVSKWIRARCQLPNKCIGCDGELRTRRQRMLCGKDECRAIYKMLLKHAKTRLKAI